MHGFIHLHSKTSCKVRFMWICVVFLAGIGTGVHLYSLLELYLRYDYYATIKTERGKLEFPDLTICNSEAFSIYNMNLNSDVMASIMQTSLKGSTEMVFSDFPEDQKQLVVKYLFTNERYVASNTLDNLSKVLTNISELIVDCKFLDKKCHEKGEFKIFFHHIYGACYTFQPYNAQLSATNTGPDSGLSLILKGNHIASPVYDMVSNVANAASLKITVHEKGTLPPILRNGIDILPGTSTNIGLTMKKIHRLGPPYGKCQEHKELGTGSKFIYSEELCEQNVKSTEIKRKCNCTSLQFYYSNSSLKNYSYMTNCLNYDKDDISSVARNVACEKSFNASAWTESLTKCVWSCSQTDYETVISQAYWPQKSMIDSFILQYIQPLPCESPARFFYEHLLSMLATNNTFNSNKTDVCTYERSSGKTFNQNDFAHAYLTLMHGEQPNPDMFNNATMEMTTSNFGDSEEEWVNQYFYRLNIYFSVPTIEMHQQVASFGVTDLLSSVGGLMGLWSGFSIISFIEILWLLGNLATNSVDNRVKTLNADLTCAQK